MIARLTVSGDNIQGVQFREILARAANKRSLKGKARNLGNGDVELLFLFKENEQDIRDCIANTFESIRRTGLIGGEDVDSIKINDKGLGEYSVKGEIADPETEKRISESKRFILTREHELQEIVWALQGAGKVFLVASKEVEELLGYKKVEVVGRLESVKRELLYIQLNIKNVDDPVCIKHFIADPLIDFSAGEKEEGDLIRNLVEFYHDYVSYKKGGTRAETDLEFVARARGLRESIDKRVKKFNNLKNMNINCLK